MVLSNIVIVLARPMAGGNIGAVCRAMKNSDVSCLRLVDTGDAPEALDTDTLLARAVHAADIWQNARVFPSLREAVSDCSIVIGTSRRRGHKRKNVTLSAEQLARYLKEKDDSARAAIVFGNERTGLNSEELSLCNIASHIPASPDFPSLNLSHAVQIYTYELYKLLENNSAGAYRGVQGTWEPIDMDANEKLAQSITDSLKRIGFYKTQSHEEQFVFFRDMIARAGLTKFEAKYLHDIFAKASRLKVPH
jgi:tRNA/rRNA methyltransferase/tRNA (cytidine32/uridine32-2'-O)-methyltransferase